VREASTSNHKAPPDAQQVPVATLRIILTNQRGDQRPLTVGYSFCGMSEWRRCWHGEGWPPLAATGY
jgi:hypothetical protein